MSTRTPEHIRQTHQPRRHKLVRIQNAKDAIEHLRIVCTCDGRGWRRRRGAVPSAGVAVVDDRRAWTGPVRTAGLRAGNARKDRFVIRSELTKSWP
jgi:predicted secreted protein